MAARNIACAKKKWSKVKKKSIHRFAFDIFEKKSPCLIFVPRWPKLNQSRIGLERGSFLYEPVLPSAAGALVAVATVFGV